MLTRMLTRQHRKSTAASRAERNSAAKTGMTSSVCSNSGQATRMVHPRRQSQHPLAARATRRALNLRRIRIIQAKV